MVQRMTESPEVIPIARAVPVEEEFSPSYGSVSVEIRNNNNGISPIDVHQVPRLEDDDSWISQWEGDVTDSQGSTLATANRKTIIWALIALLATAFLILVYAALSWEKDTATTGTGQAYQAASITSVMERVHLRNELLQA
jgi:beta-lactamase regulating signal transducer with metallopeptidase domain